MSPEPRASAGLRSRPPRLRFRVRGGPGPGGSKAFGFCREIYYGTLGSKYGISPYSYDIFLPIVDYCPQEVCMDVS